MFRGTRIRGSTGTGDFAEAQEQLARRIEELRSARVFWTRIDHTFQAAATKFLKENQHKRSIGDDAMHLKELDLFVGNLALRQVHMGSLQEFIAKRRRDSVKTSTINGALAITRHIRNLVGSEWMDDHGVTWLERAPKIKLLPIRDARAAYPPQAPLRSAPAGGRGVVRGPTGLTRAQERANHHALLACRTLEPHFDSGKFL